VKERGNTNGVLKNIKMEKMNLISLSPDELKEINGGFLKLIIGFLLPNPKRIIDFIEGYREGYERGTATP
jgi:hypothetical protein